MGDGYTTLTPTLRTTLCPHCTPSPHPTHGLPYGLADYSHGPPPRTTLKENPQGLPYPTLPYPTLPYPTLPYPTLPYPTLPYPTLPYPTLPSTEYPTPTHYSHALPSRTILRTTLKEYSTDFPHGLPADYPNGLPSWTNLKDYPHSLKDYPQHEIQNLRIFISFVKNRKYIGPLLYGQETSSVKLRKFREHAKTA